jgi:hypothetical protein
MDAKPTHDFASEAVLNILERPLDELDALVGLLCLAHQGKRNTVYGNDLVAIDKIVLRRIRKLARKCLHQHTEWKYEVRDAKREVA